MAIQEEDLCHGYDYNFVDEDPSKKYSCSICQLVARDPQQVPCCSNLYCKICLQKLQSRNRSTFISQQPVRCPSCREPLGNYFSDGRTKREIDSLKVYCTNSEEGCKWKGTINETGTSIEAHLNSCPYQLIPCTNECGEEVLRMSLHDHIEENCCNRLVKCQYCKEDIKYQYIGNIHPNQCPDYPVKCSNEECSKKIPRRLLASHNETCPKAIITCEYNTVGCNKRMKREEKEEHDEESVKTHFQMAVKRFKESQDEVTKLKAAVTQSDVLKLCHFSEKKEQNEEWYSPCFYTSLGGYKMKLKVYPNGDGNGKGTHVSCYICLMSGEYDDTLEWPFRGEVTIELLNQLADSSHFKANISFNNVVDDTQELGILCFISHSKLNENSSTKCQFLKDDILYFRVSVKVTSQTKPWLAGVTGTNVTMWIS